MPLALELIVLLVALSFAGGVIGGLGGPGAVPVLVVLYLLTPLTPAQIAGTISATNLFSVSFGSAVYNRSRNVDWSSVPYLVPATFVGTRLGVEVNGYLSDRTFGYVLVVVLLFMGGYTTYQEFREFDPIYQVDLSTRQGSLLVGALGLGVGVVGGATGVSGVPIAILAMILFGVPVLTAIGTAMVLGVFISASTAGNFLLQDAVLYRLVALMAPFFVAGIATGWALARRIKAGSVRVLIGAMVLLLAFVPLL